MSHRIPKPTATTARALQLTNPIPREGYRPKPLPNAPGESALVQPMVVIDEDGREEVRFPQDPPFNAHGRVATEFSGNVSGHGTGTLIGSRYVLTAGHVVRDLKHGFAKTVTFAPGQHGLLPTRLFAVQDIRLPPQFENDPTNAEWDLALLILSQEVGIRHYDATSFRDNDLRNLNVNITGYPKDKGGFRMYSMGGVIESSGIGSQRLSYTIDTDEGQSGGAVWAKFRGDDSHHVVGVHVDHNNVRNFAVRITDEKVEFLKSCGV